MARVQLGESRLRARRRRRRALAAALVAACLLVCAGGLAWLSRAPFLRITAVKVQGAQTVDSSLVQQYVQTQLAGSYGYLFAKNNIALYPKQTIAAGLVALLPTLQSVTVRAQGLHTIAVTLSERQPVAQWCGSSFATSSIAFEQATSSCFLLDQNGFAYAPAPNASAAYLTYYGALATGTIPSQYLTPAQFRPLFALVQTLQQDPWPGKQATDTLQSVYVDENQDVYVGFSSGFDLIFALSSNAGDVYQRFLLALEAQPFTAHPLSAFEYLDLRFGDKLYYKLKGGE